MQNISVIGTGYVGLVTGTCLAESGMHVTCMDVDQNKIDNLMAGKIPIFEPGLEDLVKKNYREGRLKFTTSMIEAVDNSTAIFIAVGTPPQEDGSADLRHVLSAVREIAKHMLCYKVIIDKSTVPVGTGQKVRSVVGGILCERGKRLPFDVVSNPEFLREGEAVQDFLHPDRVVIGCETEKARSIMQKIYNVIYPKDTPFIFTDIETAELIKYASNAFLATKISFINQIANLCEAAGADVSDVVKAMGLDKRIGKSYLKPGPGYGGSCLPKDTKALLNIGRELNVDLGVLASVIVANENQKQQMVEKIKAKVGTLKGCTIAVLGIAFKAGTDDVRESPSVTIIKELINGGARVKAYDPVAIESAQKLAFEPVLTESKRLEFCADELETARASEALVVVTEWNQFKQLDLNRIRAAMKGNLLFDFRNIYDKACAEQAGFEYQCIGRNRSVLPPE